MNTDCKDELVKDIAMVLKNSEDVEKIIPLIRRSFYQSWLRGEEILVEVWVLKVKSPPKRSIQ